MRWRVLPPALLSSSHYTHPKGWKVKIWTSSREGLLQAWKRQYHLSCHAFLFELPSAGKLVPAFSPILWLKSTRIFFKAKLLWNYFINSARVPHWTLLPGGACFGEGAMDSHASDVDPLSLFSSAPSITHTEISQLRRNSDFSFLWPLSILFFWSPKKVKMSGSYFNTFMKRCRNIISWFHSFLVKGKEIACGINMQLKIVAIRVSQEWNRSLLWGRAAFPFACASNSKLFDIGI